MPPQIQALLQDKRMLAIIGGVLGLLVLIMIGFMFFGRGKISESEKALGPEQKILASINGYGKAIEIQALLSRQGIHLKQDDKEGESKIKLLFEDDAVQKDRDKALVTLVQSGLMDKNVGLEAFDKGDLTASREEKRIKLVRSQQGELTRLIKKIDPIEDASVNIAIPEQTLFRSDEKPLSASVQVTVPTGTRLGKDKVRAISNLMVGSLQGLEAAHVAISDTNGNTYSSVLDPASELDDKLETQDAYMKQKVSAQLDRLVGSGNYVVTVSTQLRQAPKEMMSQSFDPHGNVVSSKQAFKENLNTNGPPGAGGPTSSFLPNALAAAVTNATPNKDYLRNGVEVSYNNSKTQWVETRPVGMVEDVSIAVTIDAGHFPEGMSLDNLQNLLAHAASPQVRPENVSIARSDMQSTPPLGSNHGDGMSGNGADGGMGSDLSWLYWAGGAVVFCVLMIFLLSMKRGGNKDDSNFIQTQQELQHLREFAAQQQAQLQATQQQTQMLLEVQQKQLQQAQEQNNKALDSQSQNRLPQNGGLQQALEELREVVQQEELSDDDHLDLQIKSWIESS